MKDLKKNIEPKVYCLIIEGPNTTYLTMQYTYSLEEAFTLGRMEFESTVPPIIKGPGLLGAKIGLFAIKTVAELITNPNRLEDMLKGTMEMSRVAHVEAKGVTPAVAPKKKTHSSIPSDFEGGKNALMRKIIEKKDLKTYEKNRKFFSKSERAYIRSQLK